MIRWHTLAGVLITGVAAVTNLVCAARPSRVIQVSVCSTGCSHHWGATNYTVASFHETEVVYESNYGTTVSLQLGVNGSVVSVNDNCVCVDGDECVQVRCANPTRFFWIDYTAPCFSNSTDWLDRLRECVCEVSETALPQCHSSSTTTTTTTITTATATSTLDTTTTGTNLRTTPRIVALSSETETSAESGLVVAITVIVLGALFIAAVWSLRRSHDKEYPEESIYAEAGPPPPPLPTSDRPPLYDLGSNGQGELPHYEEPQTYAVASKVTSTDGANPIYCSEKSQLDNAPVIYDEASVGTDGSSIENPLYDNTLERNPADPYLWVGAEKDALYDNQP